MLNVYYLSELKVNISMIMPDFMLNLTHTIRKDITYMAVLYHNS